MTETILRNATVYTQDNTTFRATALLIRGNRIAAVGGDEIRHLAGRGAREIDLEGAVVVPGFVDAHIHWMWTCMAMQEIQLNYLPTKRESLAIVAEAARRAEPGKWLKGAGWAQGDWTDTGGAFPTAADLDAVAPENPVWLDARSGHAGWANSLAMQIAGIGPDTPDPEGGSIVRGEDGHPTGIFYEEAKQLVARHLPVSSPRAIADALRNGQEAAWRAGMTGVHDYDWQDCFEAMQMLREEGTLGVRCVKHVNDPDIGHAFGLRARSGFGDEWVQLGGLKMFADGALGSVTPLMIDPICGQPDNYGIRVMAKDRMREFAMEGTRKGFPSTIHAIGDLAVRDVLDILEDTRRLEEELGIPRLARRHRIEHTQLVHPEDLGRLAELDVIASIQPIHATADIDMANRYWGERSALGYNARVQIDRGVHVVFGSDSPVEPFAPLKGIHAAVTRRRADGYPGEEGWYPEARVTVEEAIRCYTVEPAYAAGLEDRLGRLSPGFLADLVVLDKDPHTVDPMAILGIEVLGTMIDGEWKWSEGLDL